MRLGFGISARVQVGKQAELHLLLANHGVILPHDIYCVMLHSRDAWVKGPCRCISGRGLGTMHKDEGNAPMHRSKDVVLRGFVVLSSST